MFKQNRYSGFITPVSYLLDIGIIIGCVFLFKINITNIYGFLIYVSLFWITIAFTNHFYEIHRHTRIVQILTLLFKQMLFFSIVLYAFIGLFKQPNISRLELGNYLLCVFLLVTFIKFLIYFLLNIYRSTLGGNLRNVIVIGNN